MLFGWNFPVNAFDDFSQTSYAEDNTPNATKDWHTKRNQRLTHQTQPKTVLKKTLQEVEKASEILLH